MLFNRVLAKSCKNLHTNIINFPNSSVRLLIQSQVSRSIGDAYLKKAEFNREPLLAKFRLPEPFEKPILLAEPSVHVQKLQPEDQFLIFASDGLWEHLSNQEAVNIVHNSPRNVNLLNRPVSIFNAK